MENNQLKAPPGSTPRLLSYHKWLADLGATNTTGWRWRKKGVVQTINIYGRLYITEAEAANFVSRATAGEFAQVVKPGTKRTATDFTLLGNQGLRPSHSNPANLRNQQQPHEPGKRRRHK